ncbi:hypothetical protein V2J94_47010 [Streptomyces sp. DSM 41524]|uniref:Uncharacterized protein n=1 Tax=Streptomyces asiaticus subsp. ignotus TaxID=3098222 RepID=A0ABU7QD24_9ACTN|nr:hypothetical protein [Streptomyces sp. DSM 41524]
MISESLEPGKDPCSGQGGESCGGLRGREHQQVRSSVEVGETSCVGAREGVGGYDIGEDLSAPHLHPVNGDRSKDGYAAWRSQEDILGGSLWGLPVVGRAAGHEQVAAELGEE